METQWIRCKDAMPEDGQRVLVAGTGLNTGGKSYAYYESAIYRKQEDIFIGAYGYITHWIKFPDDPPEE